MTTSLNATKDKARGQAGEVGTPKQQLRSHRTTLERASKLIQIRRSHPSNSTAAQHARILAALAEGPTTTVDMVRFLDITRPGARICELRDAGAAIDKVMIRQVTEAGEVHRFALYFKANKIGGA